jgi:hypothetical membrane protein
MRVVQAAQRRIPGRVGEGLDERPAVGLTPLAWAGVVGPVLFTVMFVGQELFRRDEYSPMAEPVSALEAGSNGWVQQVNFVVFGLLTIAFAIGLHLGLRTTRAGILGPALLFVSGIGLLLAAVFPLREDAAGITYDPGGHIVAGLAFFVSSAVGLIVLSRRLARDPRWQSIATYTRMAGAVSVVGFVVMGALVMPDDAPLHEWAGLAQRLLILVVLFPFRVVLSLRLLQVASGERTVRPQI